MSDMYRSRMLGILCALVFLAFGCTNPADDISLDVLPEDTFEAVTGDGWLETFLDVVHDAEDVVCVPDCTDIECGDDGCGGETCGKCTQGLVCADSLCVPDCDLACEGLDCGDGGTEGFCDCGACSDGYGCTDEGTCSAECGDLCTDLECGPAGDDGECDCGGCDEYYICVEGSCEPDCETSCAMAECTPEWAEGLCDCGECDDENSCTEDVCQADGTCDFAGLDEVDCDDGDLCTEDGMCEAGICVSAPVVCDDDNLCTDDHCDSETGECALAPNDDDCDDLDPCTLLDQCANGYCSGTPVDCECETDLDCGKVDDGDLCNGTLFCDTTLIPHICKVDPGTLVECPDPDDDDPDAPCLQAACDPDSGECGFTEDNEGFPCADPDLCSVADFCEKGECVGGMDANCNDGNPCTDDTCDSEAGCMQTPNEAPCEDGDPCTAGDQCQDGECIQGPTPVCDDGNPCTTDLCDSGVVGGCVFASNQSECDDGNVCTLGDSCSNGECLAGSELPCDDGNVCTNDSCDPELGCAHLPNTSICDDEDPCTLLDVCIDGLCSGSGDPECDDENDCTVDLCEPGAGCVFLPGFGACDDGNACTLDDLCIAGLCQADDYEDCDDSNPCTTDTCDTVLGCLNAPNVLPCDDEDACTLQDTCQGGSCHGLLDVVCEDQNPCTADICDPNTGCEFPSVSGACDDGNPCTAVDTCANGMCQGAGPEDCDDNSICTTDSCDPDVGCVNAPNTLPCNDGNPCTFPDACGGSTCGGASITCDDGNICTDDSCDPAVGCVHTPNSAPCNDQSECTLDDLCLDGSCQGTGSLDCDDGNLCTLDLCLPEGGCDYELLSDIPCTDDDLCTLNDTCVEGQCESGAAPDCDDENTCTEDACVAGLCENTPDPDAECSDGNACTTDDGCTEDGDCVAEELVDCNDQNPCTDDWCDPEVGCQHEDNLQPCTDFDACTHGDMCGDQGECVSGEDLDCDDGNPCTDDWCDLLDGCINAPNNLECDDGNACTTDDVCVEGLCVSPGDLPCDDSNACTLDSCDPTTGCVNAALVGPCSDGDSCTAGDHCVDGQCVPGPDVVCEDGNPCTDDSCVEGQCVFAPADDPCDDQNACTLGDHCGGGECLYEELVDCDDDEPCTLNACDPEQGCYTIFLDDPCTDNDVCTVADHCVDGECVSGDALECDDDNPCTDDGCDLLEGCFHAANVDECDDDNPCTLGDHCSDGICAAGETAQCDDDDVCTTDSCDPVDGCQNVPNAAPCDDGSFCTDGDTCADGECVGAATSCNDGNPCTDDTCDPAAGCVFTATDDPCDDQNECTTGDVCAGGVCLGEGSLECDDDNICTKDICLPDGGCDHVDLTDTPCSDDDLCTLNDTCAQGVCEPGEAKDCDDGSPCTVNSCDADTGVCLNEATDADCDDGNTCTTGDACVDGACGHTGLLDCDDGNPCTLDSCDSVDGCVYEDTDAPCDDGDACTDDDQCVDGECAGVGDLDCDDGNPCTDDLCDPVGGCTYVMTDAECSDGNACTDGDHCDDGACAPGSPVSCDDLNACTKDACQPLEGCVYTNVDNPCSDLDTCTTGDTCVDGECVPTGDLDCEDLNPCTDDSCDVDVGCMNTPNQDDCTDNTVCTVGDQCLGGQCVPGAKLVCADENICTDDLCNPQEGCVFEANAAPCSEGTVCAGMGQCANKECAPGVPLDCGDDNPCTDDSCHPVDGCQNVPNQADCTDGNECTLGDHCSGGECLYTGLVECNDNVHCTTDSCDPLVEGGCVNAANTLSCDDGNACTNGDQCQDKQCVSGAALVCNDGNECTDDECVTTTGCVFTNNQGDCDDQNDCTTTDYCLNGECLGEGSEECDDQNICTKDVCLPDGGCDHINLTDTPCSDDDPCTVGDVCDDGVCQDGADLQCDDGNDCTDDSCVDGQCVFATNTAACSDDNECTIGDVCENKVCVNSGAPDCDDDNDCTTDSCNPTVDGGCVHTANDFLCSDGNDCTTGDHCVEKQCVGTGTVTCDDDNACTDDTCNEDGGCEYSWDDTNPCSDSDVCTEDDYCSDGDCISGSEKDCSDSYACTLDSCHPVNGCSNLPLDGLCNDSVDCTTDACDPTSTSADADGCTQVDNPVDCVLGDWTPWSPCSEQCGGGTRVRSRQIITPAACGGAACGDTEESEACNTDPCVVDCEWHWGDWSICSGDCPTGSQTRVAVIDVEAQGGGTACPTGDAASETQTCSMVGTDCDDGNFCTLSDTCITQGCAGTPATSVPVGQGGCDDGLTCTLDECVAGNAGYDCSNTNQPVNCVVGGWTAWSTCASATGACTDTTTRTRSVVTPASCGGFGCPALEESETCFVADGTECDDGIYCTVLEVCDGNGTCAGMALDAACDDQNGCTTNECNPTSTAADGQGCVYTNVPVDCEVSAWSDWSACSQTGDTCAGSRSRARTVTQQPSCGGAACPDLSETGDCNMPVDTVCDDGVLCTVNDDCDVNGTCAGTDAVDVLEPVGCDDGEVCTTDACLDDYVTVGGATPYTSGKDFNFVENPSGTCDQLAGVRAGRIVLTDDTTITTLAAHILPQQSPAPEGDLSLTLYADGNGTLGQVMACGSVTLTSGFSGDALAVLDTPVLLQAGTYWLSGTAPTSFTIGSGTAPGAAWANLYPSGTFPCACPEGSNFPQIGEVTDEELNLWVITDSFCSHTSLAVDCVGAWVDDGPCAQSGTSCTGTKGQTYAISVPASCGGDACPNGNGDTQSVPCNMPAQTQCDDGDDCTSTDVCGDGDGVCAGTDACDGSPVINEVDYDQPILDTAEFVEIYNPGTSGVDLSELKIEFVDGLDGTTYRTYDLDSGLTTNLLGAGMFLVIGPAAVTTGLPQGTLGITTVANTNLIQNDDDGLRIVTKADSTFVDGIAYEGAVADTGEGDFAAADLDTGAAALGRCPDGADTGDNWDDFPLLATPTPGAANDCDNPLPLQCEEDCAACSSAETCTICDAGFTLVNGDCNAAPEMLSVTITPSSPTVQDTLTCTPSADDAESDSITYSYAWSIDAATVGTSSTLSSSFIKGDTVVCTVTPNDTHQDGDPDDDQVTIGNSLPTISTVSISPSSPGVDDTLTCSYSGFSDADNDSDSSTYSWTISGTEVGTSSTLSSGYTSGDTVTCTVTPYDGTDAGTAKSEGVSIQNTAPSISSVSISPSSPEVSDTLTCSYSGYDDADGDGDQSTYSWTIGGTEVGTSSTLSSGYVKGDTVICVVVPFDGTDAGTEKGDSVTIQNTVPVMTDVSISPTSPVVSDTLTCTPSADDDDDADTVTFSYSWSIGGTEVGTSSTLSSGYVKDDTVVCTVTPHDGTDPGTPDNDSVDVQNSIPMISSVSISPSTAYTGNSLTCSYSGYSDADNDSDSSTYSWTISGTEVGTSSTLSSSSFSKGDTVTCTVTPYDGTDAGTAKSDNITIQNTPPSISSVSISPSTSYAGDTLTCSYSGYSDADGDGDQSTYSWTIGGTEVGTSSTLSSGFVGGDSVVCTVTPYDGTDSGTADSDSVDVQNTAPSIASVSITPSPAVTSDTLTCSYSGYSDADGDGDQSTYSWTIGGTPVGNTSTLDSSEFSKGYTVICTVTPNDGTDDGTPMNDTITIQNSPPVLSDVSITPGSPVVTDTLTCTPGSSSDADNDSVLYGYSWTVDGSEVGTSSTLSTGFVEGDTVTCTVTPDDLTDYGTAKSDDVTIACEANCDACSGPTCTSCASGHTLDSGDCHEDCAEEPDDTANSPGYHDTDCDGTPGNGGACTLTCDQGYVPSEDATCTGGSWDAPTCDADETHPAPTCCAGPFCYYSWTFGELGCTGGGGVYSATDSCAIACPTSTPVKL